MDSRTFAENLFGVGGNESPMTPQNQFQNQFEGLNDIPIP